MARTGSGDGKVITSLPTKKQRTAYLRALRGHLAALRKAKTLGELGQHLGAIVGQAEAAAELHGMLPRDLPALAGNPKLRDTARWKEPIPPLRAKWGDVRSLIIDYASKHATMDVDDLWKTKAIRNRTTRHSLMTNLHSLSTVGTRPLKKSDSGVPGPNGKPARYSLRAR